MAGIWAGGFAILHFSWALGGDAGQAVSTEPQLVAERPTWFVVAGLWGIGVLCVAGMTMALELTRSRLRGTRRILVEAARAPWTAAEEAPAP
ncbi:DUF3995 domain-containing protein [Actinoplanes regularis]|uniref:DUF3995 domain-containing protein n=1 Tax=Actinoplanes regularis TaxID=52697 RepID=UPI0024A153CD|nr:hypothetical protein Areg01_20450 [Actinoplanes regularis]